MSAPAVTKGSDSPKSRDDTAHFPCGAAHHDEQSAESAIREYPMAPRHGVLLFAGRGWRLPAGVTVALAGKRRFRLGRPGSPRWPLAGAVAGGIVPFFAPCKVTCEIFSPRSCGEYEPGGGAIALTCTWHSEWKIRRCGQSNCAGANGRRQRA